MNSEATTTTTAAAPAEEEKKSHKSHKEKKSSSSSSKQKESSSKDDSKKEKSKKKSSSSSKKEKSKSDEGGSKDEKKKSSSSSDKNDASAKEDKSANGENDAKATDNNKKNEIDAEGEENEETQKLVTLLTEDIWTATTASETATVLTTLLSVSNDNVSSSLAMEMGAPLLVARKMKDFADAADVQLAALELWHRWTTTIASTESSSSSWYPLMIRVGALARVCNILTTTSHPGDDQQPSWSNVQDKALSILEQMASSAAAKLLVRHQGVETLTQLFVQEPAESDSSSPSPLVARVSDILLKLATDNATTAGRDKIVANLCAVLSDKTKTHACQTAILAFFNQLLQNETAKVDLVPLLVRLGVLTHVQTILGNEGKLKSNDETADLVDKSMTLFEQAAASEAANLLIEDHGVETLKSIVQGKNGTVIPRALEVLYLLSARTGTTGRAKITEEMGELLRDSPYVQLQSAIISLLSEMANTEETAQGLVQGQGIESLVYVWETFRTDRSAVSDKALDLLVLLAVKGGTTSRQAIVDTKVLTTIAAVMRDEPANDTIHTRGRQMASALAAEHEQIVDESGILKV